MKKLPIFGLVAVLIGLGIILWPSKPAVNPDPNHIHADFMVFVNGLALDFSDARYMSAPAPQADLQLIPSASAHENEGEAVAGREYIHLHDDNGYVIHVHKPGLELEDFFTSIGFTMTDTCLTLDDFQFSKLDAGWVRDFGRTKDLCNDGKFHWTMMLNGETVPMDHHYAFKDLDKILLTYGASDVVEEQFESVTNDACLYSKTCPERGDPPVENCIADPAVPCVEVLE